MSNTPLIAVLAMMLSMMCYQISASFAKQLIAVLDPLSVTILRLCFASVLVFFMFRSWKILSKLSTLKWREWQSTMPLAKTQNPEDVQVDELNQWAITPSLKG